MVAVIVAVMALDASVLAMAVAQQSYAVETKADSFLLLGTWSLAYDPDRSPPDMVTFYPGGAVVVRMPDGRVINGTYAENGKLIELTLAVRTKTVQLSLARSEDARWLVTSTGAQYRKETEASDMVTER
jgi:hypothetical protein